MSDDSGLGGATATPARATKTTDRGCLSSILIYAGLTMMGVSCTPGVGEERVALFIVAVITLMLGNALQSGRISNVQAMRDAEAQSVQEIIEESATTESADISGHPDESPAEVVGQPRFCLYLRPGILDTRLTIDNPHAAGPIGAAFQQAQFDLEHLIADAIAQDSLLVTVGYEGDQRRNQAEFAGGGTASFGPDWQGKVAKLIEKAWLIFLVPGITEGIHWEISTISGTPSLLAKTLWIMPPGSSSGVGAYWEAIREKLSEKSINLPRFQTRGMMFILGADGRIVASEQLAPSGSPIAMSFLIAFFFPLVLLFRPRRQIARRVERMVREAKLNRER